MSSWYASIPSPGPEWQQIPIDIFGLHWRIQTYAIMILIGIVVAAIWTSRRLTKRGAEPGVVLDILLWAVPLGIVGARLYHVITHPADYFYEGADLWKVLFIWEGGNAIFGSLIGGAVGAWIGCRWTGLRFWTFADAVAPALLLAQAIGRLGNYFNQELFGLPTNLPWGLEIDAGNKAIPVGLPDGTLFQPLFLYEIIWNVAGIVVLLLIERKFKPRWGIFFGMYLIWYGVGRSYLESIRIDPSEFGFLGIPSNVWAAFGAIALGLVIVIVQSRRHHGAEPSVYRRGYEWSPAGDDVHSEVSESAENTDGVAAAGVEDSGKAEATSHSGS